MNKSIHEFEASQLRTDLPDFKPGDTVRVHARIVEGDKERIQVFEGVVICQANSGSRATFTVRKISYGVGVERIFPLHSPRIDRIEVTVRGKVRRAKLYYLRGLRGKAARLKGERVRPAAEGKKAQSAPAAAPGTDTAQPAE